MDINEANKVEQIIRKIVEENTDKSLDEIKRMVKMELRRRDQTKGRQDLGEQVAPKVGTEEIIEIITTKGLLRKGGNVQEEDRGER